MKNIAAFILFISAVQFLLTGCRNQDENPDPGTISGKVTATSDCKNFLSGELKFAEADTFSCAHYLYNETAQVLTLNHINSGFNCCPDKISCEVSLNNDTIIITESEKKQDCLCNCLFDLDIEIQNVAQETYTVRFIEPYALDKPVLIFEMNLNENAEGEYCVVRKGYPWGE